MVEFGGIAESEHLTAVVTGEDAMRAFGFERHHRHVPGTRAIRRRNAAARQAFKRFQLKHRGRGLNVTQSTCRNCHTRTLPSASGHAIRAPVNSLDRHWRVLVPSAAKPLKSRRFHAVSRGMPPLRVDVTHAVQSPGKQDDSSTARPKLFTTHGLRLRAERLSRM